VLDRDFRGAEFSWRHLSSQHKSYWLLDLRSILPVPAAMAVEVGFCLYLLWLAVEFCRNAQSRERVVVAGLFAPIFLRRIQNIVPMSAAAAIDYLSAVCTLVALLAAVDILLKFFATDHPRLDDQASSK
jgi:hypothetical protein